MPGWRGLWCSGLVLLICGCGHPDSFRRDEPTERIKGGDSATLRIHALIAQGQLAEAEALLLAGVSSGLVSQEAASRLREAMSQRQNAPQRQAPGPSDPQVAPWMPPDAPSSERRACDTEFSTYPTCHELPEEYTYHSVQQALGAMKQRLGAKGLALHKAAVAQSGPCLGIGDHYNVRSNGERAGSITCCPCCVDTGTGPLMWEKCRIVW